MSLSAHIQQGVQFTENTETARSTADGRCSECGHYVARANVSEAVCPECDIVVEDAPISTRGVRLYDTEDFQTRSRTGGRVTSLRSDGGIGAGVEWNAYTDGNNASLSSEKKRLFRETFWKKCRSNREYTLDYGFGEIRRMGSALAVPSPEREEAAIVFRRCIDAGFAVGRCLDAFATASLLAAVRNSSCRTGILLSELEAVSRATSGQLRNARGKINYDLDGVSIPPLQPEDLVPRLCSELSAPNSVVRLVDEFVAVYQTRDHGHSFCPRTVVGAAFHAAYDMAGFDQRPSLAAISEPLDVHGSTVSERKGDLLECYERSDN